jgi:hypothetical protein
VKSSSSAIRLSVGEAPGIPGGMMGGGGGPGGGEEIAAAKAVPEEGRQTVVEPVDVSGDLCLT